MTNTKDVLLLRFDLQSVNRKETNIEMCKKIEDNLKQQKLFLPPICLLMDNIKSADKDKVKAFMVFL